MANKEAEQAAEKAAADAENARRAAEQADDLSKYEAMLKAQKLAAEAADKKRDAEFKEA